MSDLPFTYGDDPNSSQFSSWVFVPSGALPPPVSGTIFEFRICSRYFGSQSTIFCVMRNIGLPSSDTLAWFSMNFVRSKRIFDCASVIASA